MAPSRQGDALTSSAPLYITIGPQCCGKTTFLKNLGAQDISLDDQPDVYVPVPTHTWLAIRNDHNASESNSTKVPLLLKNIQGKSIEYRMKHDNAELNLILQRWDQRLSPQNFAIALLQHYSTLSPPNKNIDTIKMAHTLAQVVEEFISNQPQKKLPEYTQVFCLESLFRSHATTNQSAIQSAHAMLRKTPSHIPVAWGNTNSKGRDYQQALEIACQARRPVHFVLSHPSIQLDQCLPWVEPQLLLHRNLQRLCDTGKYIPANAIYDCCHRIEQIIPPRCEAPWQVEQALAAMASQVPRHHRNPPKFRYRLTNQRLVQKQYPEQQQQQQQQQQQEQHRHHPQQQRQQYQHPEQQRRGYNSSSNNQRRFNDPGHNERRPYGNGNSNGNREDQRWQPPPSQQGNKRGPYDDNRRGNNDNKRQRWDRKD